MSDEENELTALGSKLKRMLFILLIILVIMYGLSYYVIVRTMFTIESRSMLVGPTYYQTKFDAESSFQRAVYYVFLPIGKCDEMITDQEYVLEKSLLETLDEKLDEAFEQ